MLLRYLKILLPITSLILIAFSTSSVADDTCDDKFHLEVAPYLWALNMNGTIKVGEQTIHLDQDFSDILQQLKYGGMLWLDLRKGKWDIFLNSLYADLTDSAKNDFASVDETTNFGLFTLGAGYEIYRHYFNTCTCSAFTVSPYAGARYTLNDVKVTLNLPTGSISASDNQHWTDPIVGAKLGFILTQSWVVTLAADVGGTNTNTDYSYNFNAILGYKPQKFLKNTSFYLGYRALTQHYVTGSGSDYFKWDMRLFGPIVGVSYTF